MITMSNLLVTGLIKELRPVKFKRGLTEKMAIFTIFTYFPTWMGGGGLGTGCHRKMISIHEIETGPFRLRKLPMFGLEIGFLFPLSSNSRGLLYMRQNNDEQRGSEKFKECVP